PLPTTAHEPGGWSGSFGRRRCASLGARAQLVVLVRRDVLFEGFAPLGSRLLLVVTFFAGVFRASTLVAVARALEGLRPTVSATKALAQLLLTGQVEQAGLRAVQMRRPWKMRVWLTMSHSLLGRRSNSSCSIFSGVVC